MLKLKKLEADQTMMQSESEIGSEVSTKEKAKALAKAKAVAKARALSKAKAEKEAIERITEATLAGIKAGEEASKRLHDDAKLQTEDQTTRAVEKLKNKFDTTKK